MALTRILIWNSQSLNHRCLWKWWALFCCRLCHSPTQIKWNVMLIISKRWYSKKFTFENLFLLICVCSNTFLLLNWCTFFVVQKVLEIMLDKFSEQNFTMVRLYRLSRNLTEFIWRSSLIHWGEPDNTYYMFYSDLKIDFCFSFNTRTY